MKWDCVPSMRAAHLTLAVVFEALLACNLMACTNMTQLQRLPLEPG